jgi:tRNA pseudouridine38-40 synthase
VHALGQVANFISDTNIESSKIKVALNANLPSDIRVIDSVEVPLDFHSRFHAHEKTYMYQVYNSRISCPFYSNFSWFVPYTLDFDKMESSLKVLVGTHDFAAFMAAGSDVKTTVRTIYGVKLTKKGEIIRLYITGNGFLYNMVRIIAGTLVDIGKGRKSKNCFEDALTSCDRTKLGQTAKAEGLFLKEVKYN